MTPTVRITVRNNTVQQDRLNPPDRDEAELVHWKRIKTEGEVRIGDALRFPFEALLDLRSRLMQVSLEDNPDLSAGELANFLVNEMCRYVPFPRGRLFIQRPVISRTRVEWMVTDAVQVSGLLHRLKEAKEFVGVPIAPRPEPLGPLLGTLVEEVLENLRMMSQWEYDHQQHRRNPVYVRFHRDVWDMVQPRFRELVEEPEMTKDFTRFFELVGFMAAPAKVLLATERPAHPMAKYPTTEAEAALGVFYHVREEAKRLGNGIVQRYGTAEQQKADQGPRWK